MGIVFGLLTISLGLGLGLSPWLYHFTGSWLASVAAVGFGLTTLRWRPRHL